MDEALQAIFEHIDRSTEPPWAVFDCDDTMIRGDIGEAMLFHQLDRFLFRVSPAEIWIDHPDRMRIDRLFHELRAIGDERRRTHSSFDHFLTMVLDWYYAELNAGRIAKGCADIVKLFAGFTVDEVRFIARDVLHTELNSPITRLTIGRHTVARGIRYMKRPYRLMKSLVDAGLKVMAVSGSNQWSVEAVFNPLGMPIETIIGIDLEEHGGILTDKVREPIPVHSGKVEALTRRITGRPVVCVSDSVNDVPLLLHASKLRVLVRSSYSNSFFERAGITQDSSWLIIEDDAVFNDGAPGPIIPHAD